MASVSRRGERRPAPPPVDTDDRTPVLIGLVAWAIALVVVLIAEPVWGFETPAVMLWSSVAGVALGLLGLVWVLRRRRD